MIREIKEVRETSLKAEHITVKRIVEDCLAEDIKCRNDDWWLLIKVLKKLNFNIYIPYEKLSLMPKPESIRRVRQHIQNTEKRYIATDEKVKRSRRQAESDLRKLYGGNYGI